MPKQCSACGEEKGKKNFDGRQWKTQQPVCRECQKEKKTPDPTSEVVVRGQCSRCGGSVTSDQPRKKDLNTGEYLHEYPEDCDRIGLEQYRIKLLLREFEHFNLSYGNLREFWQKIEKVYKFYNGEIPHPHRESFMVMMKEVLSKKLEEERENLEDSRRRLEKAEEDYLKERKSWAAFLEAKQSE